MRLLTQRVSSGMENVSATLAAVQVEVRGCSTNVSELRGLQGAHDSNKVAIDKVEKSVSDLGMRLEAWFDEFEAKQEQRRSEEHTSELQSLMRISYAVFCLKKKTQTNKIYNNE